MECPESPRTQAYFDGEADVASTAAIERHIETCSECQAQLHDLEQVRGLLRDNAAPLPMPDLLRARILRSLDEEPPVAAPPVRRKSSSGSRPFWFGLLSGVGGSAIAAALAFLVIVSVRTERLQNELVTDHTHSLLSAHLIAVVSTSQHTVKPWFAGRTDISPVVADFAQQGYRLLGGRIDTLRQRPVPVVVYQHGAHFINVFSWVAGADAVPKDTTRNGYHLAFWQIGNLVYCAVSDTGWSELQTLVNLLRDEGNKSSAP